MFAIDKACRAEDTLEWHFYEMVLTLVITYALVPALLPSYQLMILWGLSIAVLDYIV